ncbi:fibronectin type III domain-containing protein [Actinomadura miaoliensis]|uniref:Fibronectin type-III domain-containing protein n=1 Tax=Actinomadura miaoliensis TaxID=430685 RepID=A0ABP7UVU7_9ACTN
MNLQPTVGRAVLALVATVAVVVGLIVVTGSRFAVAEPSTLALKYDCRYPQIGTKELDVLVTVDYPARVSTKMERQGVPPVEARTVATVNAETTDGLLAVRAATIQGVGSVQAVLGRPDGDLDAKPRFGVPLTRIPPVGAFDLRTSVRVPSLETKRAGQGRIEIHDLDLTIQPKKADGTPTTLGPTVVVPCTQRPGQDNVLARTRITDEADTRAPSRPREVKATAKSPTSVSLSWGRSSDDFWVSGYDVYADGRIVWQSTGPDPTATLTGLSPATPYTFTVKARDLTGNVSDGADPIQVTTDPDAPDTTPPTVPGKPAVTGLAKDTVVMSWPESTDNVAVTGYRIYADGRSAAETDTPFGWVSRLTPERTYTFTVRARDAAGNLSPPSPPLSVTMPKGPPSECGTLKGDEDWIEACAYMAGYANVAKLNSAVVLNPATPSPVLTNVAYYATATRAKARFLFVGPLRTRTTMLTFGFMPTTATMELNQLEPGTLEGEDTGSGFKARATVRMAVRLLDATVNGAPLDLGRRCVSARPMTITLDSTRWYKSVKDGGPLSGTMTIPPFSGCGAKENLDRLLNASISGGGNAVKVVQGPVCQVSQATCPPVDPVTAR